MLFRRLQPATIGLIVGVLFMVAAGLIVAGVAVEGKPTGTDSSDVPVSVFLDSPVSLASMVIASLLATVIVMRWPTPLVGILAIIFCVVFAVFDALELTTKASMGAIGFAALAAAVLGTRLVTAFIALHLVRRPRA